MNKILLIITRGDTIGGAQSHVITLCEGLLSQNFKVELIVGGEKSILSNILSAKGVVVHHVSSFHREINFIFDIISLLDIIKVIKSINPDIVSLHSSKAGFIGRLACKICKIPCVFTAHGWAFTEGVKSHKRYIFIIIEILLSKITNKVIAVSKYDFNLAIKYNVCLPPKLVQIYNGINFSNVIRTTRNSFDIIDLVMVARFDIPKDQLKLIKSIIPITNIRLNLIGDGPNLLECRKYVDDLGIQNKVIFHGFVSNVRDFIKNMDIFILISNYEGFPISTIEAMSVGMPIIISNVGGASEAVINGENGYLVDNQDLNTITNAVKNFTIDPQLIDKMGLKSRELYLNCFESKKMVDSTIITFKNAFLGS